MKIAIDARILMKNHARRMVTGAAECASVGVVLPETATTMAKLSYHRVAARYVEKVVVWSAEAAQETLSEDAMEDWLDGVQGEGRYEHVPRPFILSGQKALDTMLARVEGWSPEPEERALRRIALAHALSEPNDETTGVARRVAILGRFARDLQDCAMSVPGKNLERWQTRMYARLEDGKENRVWDEIERLKRIRPTGDVRRTREAEDRRMEWERGRGRGRRRSAANPPGGIGR